MKHKKGKHTRVKQAIELLNEEVKAKYPRGSHITFTGSCNKGETAKTLSCTYYDKVGGPLPLRNVVRNPPEWQNIPREEAVKICDMFDTNMRLVIVYV